MPDAPGLYALAVAALALAAGVLIPYARQRVAIERMRRKRRRRKPDVRAIRAAYDDQPFRTPGFAEHVAALDLREPPEFAKRGGRRG